MSKIDVKKQVDLVFSIANTLRGTYGPDKYKDVIIPMTIIRRLECALEKTKDEVCTEYEKNPRTPDAVLRDKSGYPFYNTSRYTLKNLLADPAQLKRNFKTYIQAFSPNIKQILSDLEFEKQIDKMAKGSRLTGVVRKFSDLDLHPETVNNVAMGYMFEEIIRRFSENAEAGDHYTPREVVRLLTKLALAEGCEDLNEPGKVVKVGDFACGTGGMLSCANEEIDESYPDADVYLFGQEVNPESHAICLADMLIKNQRADNIRQANTMGVYKDGGIQEGDCFESDKMRLVIMNPPFGQPWGGEDAPEGVEKAVRAEAKKPFGRFPAGTPATGDMQLLFMQHVIYKLQEKNDDKRVHGGRACVISNGSPLFSGGTSSGESQTRRWLLEHDYVEAIIGLPTDLFYNTGIGIYVWVLSKDKDKRRKGYVQLIDATDVWVPMRRSLGKKRRYISDEQIAEIVEMYKAFEPSEKVRIFPVEEFLYKEYSVYQPMQRNYCIAEDRIERMLEGQFMRNMHNPAKLEELQEIDEADRSGSQEVWLRKLIDNEPRFEKMIETLRKNVSDEQTYDPKEFKKKIKELLKTNGLTLASNELDKVVDSLSAMDKDAPLRKDRQGQIILDPTTKDTEIVKMTLDVDSYMENEVYPYVPDAKYVDEEDDEHVKTGAEIPFTRYFYKYEPPEPSDDLLDEFNALEAQLQDQLKGLIQE